MNQMMINISKKQVEHRKANRIDNIEGYPTFNSFDHTLVDLSDLRDNEEEKWGHTFSVKLPNGRFLTLAVMQSSEDQACVDVRYYGENIKTKAIGFKEGRSESIKDQGLYTIVCENKEEK